jgi:hypothetical protein
MRMFGQLLLNRLGSLLLCRALEKGIPLVPFFMTIAT